MSHLHSRIEDATVIVNVIVRLNPDQVRSGIVLFAVDFRPTFFEQS